MTPETRARIADLAAGAVRRASAELRLVTQAEVLEEMLKAVGTELPTGAQPGEEAVDAQAQEAAAQPDGLEGQELLALLPGILPEILAQHPDLACFEGISGQTLFHAPELLSRTYARILDRKGSPLTLMAEEIRANSRDYPRPVPVELFEAAPFDLGPEDIEQALRAMAASPAYQDIAFTTTASGAVHLFSTLHLERGYAAFLAQRAESLADNP